MERYRAARRDPELVVLEGFHAVKHAIRFEALIIEMAAKSGGEINALAQQLAPDVRAQLAEADELPEAEFDMLAPLPHPTGLVAIARRRAVDPVTLANSAADAPLVFLEQPAHLGNLGAAVRVGAAAGASGLLTTGQHDPWSPEAVRAAAGLQFALPQRASMSYPRPRDRWSPSIRKVSRSRAFDHRHGRSSPSGLSVMA